MRTTRALPALLLLAACSRGSTPSTAVPGVLAEVAPVEEGEDVRAAIEGLNDRSRYPAPPTEFRTGHVAPSYLLAADAITRKKGGFEVRFPSGAPITTPAVHRGKVVVSGGFHSKELYAFDARSGDLAWAIGLDDDGPSAAACDGEVCVINTESCTVFAIAADTGKQLWSWWLGDPLTSAPAIAGGKVFTSYPAPGAHPQATHVLAAFDLATGAIVWQKWIDGDVMSSPVIAEGTLFATTFAGTVMKLDPDSGELQSARRVRATSAPTVVDGRVYYSRRSESDGVAREALVRQDADLRATDWQANEKEARYLDREVQAQTELAYQGKGLDESNGFSDTPVASGYQAASDTLGVSSVSTMQTFQGSRVLHVDGTNVASMGDEIVATDADDGKVLWSKKLEGDVAEVGGFLAAPPISAAGRVFVATLSGKVLEIDPADGAVKRSHDVGGPVRQQPVAAGGWLYVPTDDGRLVAIDTGNPEVSGWAQWGGDAARSGVR